LPTSGRARQKVGGGANSRDFMEKTLFGINFGEVLEKGEGGSCPLCPPVSNTPDLY